MEHGICRKYYAHSLIDRRDACPTGKQCRPISGDQGLEGKSPKVCLRIAADLGLIENLKDWFGYLETRNLIAHTYNEALLSNCQLNSVNCFGPSGSTGIL